MSDHSTASQFVTETAEPEMLSERGPESTSEAYFLLIFQSNDDDNPSQDHQRRLQWLDDLRSSGTLLMSGPSYDRTYSICVVGANNVAEAQHLVRSDPWHDRWLRVEVIEWEIHFGLPGNRFGG